MPRTITVLLLVAALAGGQEQGGAAGEDDAELGANRLDKTNREAAAQVRRTVAQKGRNLGAQLRGLRAEDVVVIGGLFDFTQEILKAFRVPHRVVRPADLEYLELKTPERMVFFLNCHLLDRKFAGSLPNEPRPDAATARRRLAAALKAAGLDGPSAPGKAIRERFEEVMYFAGSDYSAKGLKKLGAAVRKGAWAVSMDWALLAAEKALPNSIRWTGHTTYEETVKVQASAAGRRHSLMQGVFGEKKNVKWWLETESYLFKVTAKHTTLIESRALAARYHGRKKVVVLLEPGKGRWLHALAHGYLQRGNSGDAAVMMRLLLNYLLEKSLQNWKRDTSD